MSSTRSGLGRADVARCWAGFASLGAGLVHLAVVREHLDHWVLASVFFVAVGGLQVAWGLAALARDTAPLARTAAAGSLGVLALWAVSRSTGLPFGPEAGAAEPAGRADLLAVTLHVLLVASLAVASRRATSRRPAVSRALAGLAAGALTMAALTTPALAATEAGEHARPHFGHGGGADH